MRLGLDAAGASAVLGLAARLLSVLPDVVAHSSKQHAYLARVDGPHKSVPEVARNPSWVDLDQVKVGMVCYVATVQWRLSFTRESA